MISVRLKTIAGPSAVRPSEDCSVFTFSEVEDEGDTQGSGWTWCCFGRRRRRRDKGDGEPDRPKEEVRSVSTGEQVLYRTA